MQPLKVAFVTPSLHVGGAERWILSLCKHFQHAEVAGVILTGNHFSDWMLNELSNYAPILRPGQACDADVFITWGLPNLEKIRRQYIPDNALVVDVSHSSGEWETQTEALQNSHYGATHHVAVSDAALTSIPPEIRDSAVVIYNGIEIDRICPRMGRQLMREHLQHVGIGTTDTLLLFLGRFSQEKRPLDFLQLIRNLNDEATEDGPRYSGLMVGHGPMQATLLQCIADMGLEEYVKPMAATEAVGDLYAACDAVIMPSESEGCSLVMLEAVQAGRPVITYPYDWSQWLKKNSGFPVFVTADKSAASLTDKVRALTFRDPGIYLRVDPYWTAPAMAQRWEDYLYANCVFPAHPTQRPTARDGQPDLATA